MKLQDLCRALKDCVVFPSRGKRPHPQEMAGSDLDGDEYVVIWDQRFIFPGPNVEPFEYADVPNRAPRTFTVRILNYKVRQDILTFSG